MRTSIARSISDYKGNNKVVYTLGIEQEGEPNVRLNVTGTVNDEEITMDMHATAKGYDSVGCLYETLKAILKDLERETDYYDKEEEIGF